MEEKLCKDCRFWTPEVTELPAMDHFINEQYGKCSCGKFIYIGSGIVDLDIDAVGICDWDSDGPCTSFFTGQDFGCVHHEVWRRMAPLEVS